MYAENVTHTGGGGGECAVRDLNFVFSSSEFFVHTLSYYMPGPRHQAAQQIHSTIFQRVTNTTEKQQSSGRTKSAGMLKRNKVFYTIPNPNILCLYITQVISYIRNKNLSYFPSYILCAHIKYQPKRISAWLIRRSLCVMRGWAAAILLLRSHTKCYACAP